MIASKCYNCKKRRVGCHGTCPDYKEYQAKRVALRKLMFNEKLTTTAKKTTAKVNTFSRKLYTE